MKFATLPRILRRRLQTSTWQSTKPLRLPRGTHRFRPSSNPPRLPTFLQPSRTPAPATYFVTCRNPCARHAKTTLNFQKRPGTVNFSPHHSGVLVFLVASRLPPPSSAVRRPPRLPLISSHLPPFFIHYSSHTTHHTLLLITHLTHISSHTLLISHTTHLTQLLSRLSSHTSDTTHLTHHISVAGAVRRASWRSCGADCRRSGRGGFLCGRRSTQSFLKELRRGLSPQWPRRLFAWQAQYAELPEGAAARIVAAVAASGFLCGRRSTQSFLKELRRGLSPKRPRRLFVWQAQYTELPEGAAARIVAAVAAAAFCLAGAVHRASWRSCGADCRRSGRGGFLFGRRSTQSFLKELRRGLSPQWPRRLFVWQAQYAELPEGAAARIVAAVAAAALCVAGAVRRASWRSCGADCRRSGRGGFLCGRCSTQSFLKELRRGLSPPWPRLLFVWQAQYTELPEVAAAAFCAAGAVRRGFWRSCGAVAAAALCVAGAVHRGSWRSCGADCRCSGRGGFLCGRRSTRAFWRSCGADCRCSGRGWLVVAVILLAFAEEVSVWQICVAAIILAIAEEVFLWQICTAAVILAFAEEVSLR